MSHRTNAYQTGAMARRTLTKHPSHRPIHLRPSVRWGRERRRDDHRPKKVLLGVEEKENGCPAAAPFCNCLRQLCDFSVRWGRSEVRVGVGGDGMG